jgi:hypothetical protein
LLKIILIGFSLIMGILLVSLTPIEPSLKTGTIVILSLIACWRVFAAMKEITTRFNASMIEDERY